MPNSKSNQEPAENVGLVKIACQVDQTKSTNQVQKYIHKDQMKRNSDMETNIRTSWGTSEAPNTPVACASVSASVSNGLFATIVF